MATHQVATAALAFGILGNVISFITFLSPLPTFYRIFKRKSTQGFQSIPYVVALMSAMLLLYYGVLKKDTLLISINGIGCIIEAAYVVAYLVYASRNDRMLTLKLFLSMNVLGYGAVFFTTFFLSKGAKRAHIIGYICTIFSLGVFIAPLCILGKVIKTKSVEFIPITLSIFLTLNAIIWFFYGFLKKDFFIAVPNVLGFLLGGVQMAFYAIYRKMEVVVEQPQEVEVVVEEQQEVEVVVEEQQEVEVVVEQLQEVEVVEEQQEVEVVVEQLQEVEVVEEQQEVEVVVEQLQEVEVVEEQQEVEVVVEQLQEVEVVEEQQEVEVVVEQLQEVRE